MSTRKKIWSVVVPCPAKLQCSIIPLAKMVTTSITIPSRNSKCALLDEILRCMNSLISIQCTAASIAPNRQSSFLHLHSQLQSLNLFQLHLPLTETFASKRLSGESGATLPNGPVIAYLFLDKMSLFTAIGLLNSMLILLLQLKSSLMAISVSPPIQDPWSTSLPNQFGSDWVL